MKLYIPNAMLKQVSAVLDQEKINYKITEGTAALVVEGQEVGEVTAVEAELLETEVPAFYEYQDDPRSLRAFRLPSGQRIILTDVDGNFERVVEPPPGWER